ncbi:MAG: hypothetical protein ETSY1_05300 [Candidatus Entotheonella factor]|uniref:Formyl transferase N-terminal domain-containing protein n=1 Tax=Entotheonella factor TaxID=1429438 RepID=W4LVP2_ENTF1|nr:formyltransferase family protein [Candidatus Entotheonella palauensis]ETX01968.1 MAG: hypothetical protein ETSY1_05300 [Candidatus Entotheonella factor]
MESQLRVPLKTALLIIGSGPIEYATYETLRELTNLRCVVFSRKSKHVSKWQRFTEYGLWYSAQFIISKVYNSLLQNKICPNSANPQISQEIWQLKSDQHKICQHLKALDVEVVFICGFHHILRKRFLETFSHCINIHPSLLPSYRGPEPIIWGLLDRAESFGITLHQVDEGIDTGDIVAQREIRAPKLQLAIHVAIQLSRELPLLLRQTIGQIESGNLSTQRQSGGFYLPAPLLPNRRQRQLGELPANANANKSFNPHSV